MGHVEGIFDHDIGELEYEQLRKQDKVRQIQDSLVQKAESRPNGKAAMTIRKFAGCSTGTPNPDIPMN